ncbi:MAG: cation transporter [Ignavibacteriae bacterium]|nr:cation transporter [Ignavibacteriota bacterium]
MAHTHNHAHHHHHRPGSKELRISLVITTAFMLAEAVGGYLTHSLALLADAGHMLSDAGSLALSLIAMRFAMRQRTPQMTYGYYRAEILAALVNGVTLVVISIVIFYEAILRMQSPPEVQSAPMLVIATAGLLLNLFSAYILSRKQKESLNVRGAFLHVLADALGSVGAIAAGVVMLTTGWYLVDPIVSMAIALLILFSSWRLLRESVMVLMEGTPLHLDMREIEEAIMSVSGVVQVHDLHIWTVTSGFEAVSAHVVVQHCERMEEAQTILGQIRDRIHQQFGIDHTTIQLEHVEGQVRAQVVLPH